MRRLNLLWIGLLGFAWAMGVPACSDNESEHSSDAGGSSGNGGTANTGNTSTNGGGTGGGANPDFEIGAACESNQNCATGLECLTSRGDSLSLGGPAHGFCSFKCGEADTPAAEADAECQKLDPDSLCHYFAADAGYCVQRCTFGSPGKCLYERNDVVCDRVLHEAPGAVACTSDTDCDISDLCLLPSEGSTTGVCFAPLEVCVPRCNSDQDCPPERFCDPGSGECTDEVNTGLAFDETCDPDANVDECAGFCASDGFCVEKCVLGAYPACGSTSATEATADCVFAAYMSAGEGDVGICGALCDCTADCRGDLPCVQLDNDMGPYEFRGRKGLCASARSGDIVLDSCDGAGGAGGMGGAGGQAGEGGSP